MLYEENYFNFWKFGILFIFGASSVSKFHLLSDLFRQQLACSMHFGFSYLGEFYSACFLVVVKFESGVYGLSSEYWEVV